MIIARLATVISTAAVLALGATAAPALADSHTTRDARHDVAVLPNDTDLVGQHPDARRREGDVTSLRVTHNQHRVRITMRYRALHRPSAKQGAIHTFHLRTNEHESFDVTMVTSPEVLQGDAAFIGPEDADCRGLRSRISYRHDSVRVSIPRRCLSNPRWVRVGAGYGGFSTVTRGGCFDDAQGRRIHQELVLGPRVRRG